MGQIKLVVPDLISNSYFPAVAAVELGFFRAEGLDPQLQLLFPVTRAMEALRAGEVDLVAGAAHAPLVAFPGWAGAKLLAALAHGMYWFLVLRANLGAKRGDLGAVKGLRIGAAPGPDLGLRRLLEEAGIDLEREGVRIGPIPGAAGPEVSFGLSAARALQQGQIDGFWANGMGAEVAVREGVGTVVLDVRRGDGPTAAWHYTFPSLVATDERIAREPTAIAAAVRAVVKAQRALRDDPSRARPVGDRLFPALEAGLIEDLISRDAPYYNPSISEEAVQRLNAFAQDVGLLSGPVAYGQVVATQFAALWET